MSKKRKNNGHRPMIILSLMILMTFTMTPVMGEIVKVQINGSAQSLDGNVDISGSKETDAGIHKNLQSSEKNKNHENKTAQSISENESSGDIQNPEENNLGNTGSGQLEQSAITATVAPKYVAGVTKEPTKESAKEVAKETVKEPVKSAEVAKEAAQKTDLAKGITPENAQNAAKEAQRDIQLGEKQPSSKESSLPKAEQKETEVAQEQAKDKPIKDEFSIEERAKDEKLTNLEDQLKHTLDEMLSTAEQNTGKITDKVADNNNAQCPQEFRWAAETQQ